MTLGLKQIDHDDLCHGWEWEVEDIDLLVERVARVALGQYRHVAQLEGLAGAAPAGSAQHAADALKKLKVTKNGALQLVHHAIPSTPHIDTRQIPANRMRPDELG